MCMLLYGNILKTGRHIDSYLEWKCSMQFSPHAVLLTLLYTLEYSNRCWPHKQLICKLLNRAKNEWGRDSSAIPKIILVRCPSSSTQFNRTRGQDNESDEQYLPKSTINDYICNKISLVFVCKTSEHLLIAINCYFLTTNRTIKSRCQNHFGLYL